MKGFFILVSCCIVGATAYLSAVFSPTDMETILQPRHLGNPLRLFSHSATKRRHQKRGEAGRYPYAQQGLTRRSGKAKKATTQQGNHQTGKTADQQPGRQQGNANGQQTGQREGDASGPGPVPRPPSPPPPPAIPIRAEVNFRGPGYVYTVRGQDMRDEEIPTGTRRHRIATYPGFAAAGGMSRAASPADALSQPASQHAVKTYAKGPIAGGRFIVPEGGKAHATADIPGQERQTWNLYGPDEGRITVDPNRPVPVTFKASVTDGGFVQSSGSDRSGRGPSSEPV
ncbi:MAG: hypothetical protein GOMPHAMPRED_004470 [Gomphillus americanus]|uniref:Uncharacterized protein n=1 Tax=Gomphillus americanus TaxID=1940652 RepID=A0A8H3INP7_9LECA|nr:MAG: hypothetical protein GOMPHAMPRED_004470 [Gomphillus americanus]